MLKCEVCGFESNILEEVCYYDINGNSHSNEYEIENNTQNPPALAHILCTECTEEFDFNDCNFPIRKIVKVKGK